MLSATFIRTVKTPGRYGDGRGGLDIMDLTCPGLKHRGLCLGSERDTEPH